MNQSYSELNPSSLLNLKAELSKKYETFKIAKQQQGSEPLKRSLLKNKGSVIVKNERKKDKELNLKNYSSEEHEALQKSRLALESKAKLYDQITSSKVLVDDEHKDIYLVDFDRKVLYESKTDTTKSVIEETHLRSDHSGKPSVSNTTQNKNFYIDNLDSKEKSSFSNSEEHDNSAEKSESESVHYQEVLQNEIRDHGTSYFAFSTDESKRKEQMEELNSLRQETEKQRLMKQKLINKRAAMLQARLAKVCERRNINQNVIEKFAPTNELKDSVECDTTKIDLETIPLPEASPPDDTEKKVPKVRPWDIGKTQLPFHSPKKKMKTQFQYEEERRSERLAEFAPPSWYGN